MTSALFAIAVLGTATVVGGATPAPASTGASGFRAKVEQLAKKMLPEEKLNKAAGFFGPVSKKYMPIANEFKREYQAAANKKAVIVKYLPKAESALTEAKAMKVPAKYAAEKAEYVRMAEAFVAMLKFSTAFGE